MKKIVYGFCILIAGIIMCVLTSCGGSDPATQILEDTQEKVTNTTNTTVNSGDELVEHEDNSTEAIITKNNKNIQGVWSHDRGGDRGYYAMEFYGVSGKKGSVIYYELDSNKNMTYYSRGQYEISDATITIVHTGDIDGTYSYTYTTLDGNKVINAYIDGNWVPYKEETSFGGTYYVK